MWLVIQDGFYQVTQYVSKDGYTVKNYLIVASTSKTHMKVLHDKLELCSDIEESSTEKGLYKISVSSDIFIQYLSEYIQKITYTDMLEEFKNRSWLGFLDILKAIDDMFCRLMWRSRGEKEIQKLII